MYELVYLSRATQPFSQEQLLEILRHARENNQRLDITGILLYKDGNFMQMLEGEKEAVLALFAKIRDDWRHTNVLILLEKNITERHFPDWTMALKNLDQLTPDQVPGYSDYLTVPLTADAFAPEPTHALRLLDLFKTT